MPAFLKKKSIKNPFKKDGQINKNAVLAGCLTAILLLVGIGALMFTNGQKSEPVASNETVGTIEETPKIGAVVTYREGVLEYKKTDGSWESAPQQLTVEEGMSLRTTGAASRAVVTIDDGSVFRLDANTEVKAVQLRIERVVLEQESGYVYNRVTESSTRDFIVNTDVAQFEAEGTAFLTANTGDEESVEVYESKVTEANSNNSAIQGKKLIVVSKTDPSKNNTVEDINIEEIKEDQFVMWNKALDEKDNNFKNALGFLKDLTGPEITILNPQDGSTIEIESTSTIGAVEFEGKTESGTKLTVLSKSFAGATPIDIPVGSDGSFKSALISAPVGTSVFEFVGLDKVGNKTTKIIKVTFKQKSQQATGKITLTGTVNADGKLEFSWTLSGLTAPNGVKLLASESPNPTSLDDAIGYYKTETSATIKPNDADLDSGKTYFFRVCRYTEESTCDIYSSQVDLLIP